MENDPDCGSGLCWIIPNLSLQINLKIYLLSVIFIAIILKVRKDYALLAQWIAAAPYEGEGSGFESTIDHQFIQRGIR